MSHLDCPHCGKPAITPLRKIFMGPSSPATCKMCGEKVGIPYSSWRVWKISFALTMVALLLVQSFASLIVILVAGFTLGCYLQLRRIPLVPR
jgi:uncharacterized paraquat-inducible protein A